VINLPTKFEIFSSIDSLVTAIKPTAKYGFGVAAVLLFHIFFFFFFWSRNLTNK
jgi:hypothetical protein